MIVISPYSKAGFVDHQFHSTASILEFVENNFGLPSLTAVDRQANDLVGSLDYTQKPRPPLVLKPCFALDD